MLGNTIALLTLALMLASEARRSEGAWRAGLFTLATIVALVALALDPIVDRVPAIGTALSAVFGNPLAWFILLMGLFFVLRPFWLRGRPVAANGSPAAEIPAAQLIDDWGSPLRAKERLENLEERLESLEKADPTVVFYDDSKLKSDIEELNTKIEQLGELNNQNLDYVREQVASLYAALSAVYHRERLEELAREIEAHAAILSKPTSEKASYDADAWEEWEQRETEWRDCLRQWAELADAYQQGVFAAVNYTPEKHYRGNWAVDDAQFPNSTAAYAYKTFRIRMQNWQDLREGVEQRVHRIAFDGGTATSRPIELGSRLLDALQGKVK